MTVFFRICGLVACLIGLSACTENTDPDLQNELTAGTKLTIKANGEEYYLTLGKTESDLVTSEATNWKNEFLYKNKYYRGLLLHSREENGYHWELDIDLKQVDALFPMAVGDATEITGNIIDLTDKTRAGYRAEISVVAEKPVILPSGTYTTYQVKLSQYYESAEGTKAWHQTLFYAPELMVNLKGTYQSQGEEKYWRIIKIQQPGDATPPAPPARPRRRNGTVMI